MELNKIVKRKNKIVRAGTDFFIGSFTLMCMIIANNIISERNIEAKRLISSNQIPTPFCTKKFSLVVRTLGQ